jgi:hypothetical protein
MTAWTSGEPAQIGEAEELLVKVPVGLAAMLAAPRYLTETEPQPGRLDLVGALCSTLGVTALVFGIVRSAGAGWTDSVTVGALVAGVPLVAQFVVGRRHAEQPIMRLGLFASRGRSGAYAARFLQPDRELSPQRRSRIEPTPK